MRIFIEGEPYKLKTLKDTFGEKFYSPYGVNGIIDNVGYYHSIDNEVIYLLPKVFIDTKGLILNKYPKDLFAENSIDDVIESQDELNWLKRFLIIFYKGLIEYRIRYKNTNQSKGDVLQLSSSLGENEYSFLDIVLSFVNFHKKNKNTILFIHKKQISAKHKKVNWGKTVRKSNPFITNEGVPIYSELNVKKKYIDTEEELLCMFYSVLNHLKTEYNFSIQIDESYTIAKGSAYEKLAANAPKILKKIRYKYFSDTLVKMYKLLELYFSKSNKVSIQNKNEDFIMVKYYHLIFEDMIDKLITSKIDTKETSKGVSLKKLKENKDGKIIDHLFEYDSLIDRDESIFYIGDSKYYKTNNEVQENSIYKQFTYAKNVIQFNIDLLNEGKKINNNIRYRDKVTEGYNITPNFFIQGVVTDIFNFDDDKLAIDFDKGIKHSYHFKERIFDRDSLFVNHYSINFLFVLKSYTNKSSFELEKYRVEIHKKFRTNFVSYLKKQNLFKFYYTEFESKELLKQFVDTEFRNLTGRVYISKSNDKRLILAVNGSDIELKEYFTDIYDRGRHLRETYFSSTNFERVDFSELELI
ncbi:hypothetical protein [Flavobacterium luminosum]|uniref:LlaJI family restriction endonuclease n=1 Tax=Flavobacterium luminosum TaxID=2949086 RepID=A0ABT0TRC2_9FLAO|nr:hypothetical protein [Flavobacterium sp. HXWNR70]MCL9810035.1 hypothetical protein [Flavobacterium sp. HXWNR70]